MNHEENQIDDLLNRISNGEVNRITQAMVSAIGAETIPEIARRVRSAGPRTGKALANIIRHIREKEAVPYLIDLLDDQNVTLKLTAYYALASLQDSRAIVPLLEKLNSLPPNWFEKSLAVRTLGELGQESVEKSLRDVAVKLGAIDDGSSRNWVASLTDEDEIRFALELAIAMSKLGNDELAPIVLGIAEVTPISDDSIRAEAVGALQYFICPGVFSMLRRALGCDDLSVARAAITPLQYLGHPRAVEELLGVIGPNADLADHAIRAVYEITGDWLTEEVSDQTSQDAMTEWWIQRKKNYSDGICYRLGEPIHVSRLISLLRSTDQPSDLGDELRVITGDDFNWFGDSELNQWLQDRSASFEPGRLYRYGRRKDPKYAFTDK